MQGVKGVVSANFQLRITNWGLKWGAGLAPAREGRGWGQGSRGKAIALENASSRKILTPAITLHHDGGGNNQETLRSIRAGSQVSLQGTGRQCWMLD